VRVCVRALNEGRGLSWCCLGWQLGPGMALQSQPKQ